MARKGPRTFEPISYPLEDEIPVNYTVVGTQSWFDTAFEPEAVSLDERSVISDPSQLASIKEWLDKRQIHGIDTETTGPYKPNDKVYSMNPVNPDARIVLLQIGDESHVWVIDPALIGEFKDHIESTKHLHLAHHWLYDFKFLLTKNNIHPRRMYCSMLAQQSLTAGRVGSKVGLADCARQYSPYYLISKAVRSLFIDLNNGKMSREMIQYAARDIPLLFPVYREQVKEIARHKLGKIVQLEFDVIPCTAEMELGGVYLDTDKLALLIKYWVDRQDKLGTKIIDEYNLRRKKIGKPNFIIPELDEVFDLGSNKDKLEALKKIGITLDDVKRATLLSVDDTIARDMGEYSGITKMTSTYGDNLLRKINETTGRWHPRFAQMGQGAGEGDSSDSGEEKETTATGRYVSDAQQFPRKKENCLYTSLETEGGLLEEAMDHFSIIIKGLKG
jgi:DNA polymerase I-like protein with 3'-5' exonuclease and polymerase domains